MIRRLTLLVPALLVTLLAVTGCGVGRTNGEVNRDARRTFVYDSRMLVDDMSLLFQTDRPLRTSRWIVD